MKILIISPGKAHAPEYRDAIAEYEKRLLTTLPITWDFPKVGDVDGEGAAILKRLDQSDHVILLDERGKDVSSEQLADTLDRLELDGTKRLVFIIGGAYGVSDEVRARANSVIRLSAMVFPHMLVRLVLIEQVYRAQSIRTGGKYHHA
jgi:23S rRNA (pseudouridine1915-N3)-methyltransferase